MELTSDEIKFLDDVLGHVNYDVDESDIFWSICAKLKLDKDKLKIQGE